MKMISSYMKTLKTLYKSHTVQGLLGKNSCLKKDWKYIPWIAKM